MGGVMLPLAMAAVVPPMRSVREGVPWRAQRSSFETPASCSPELFTTGSVPALKSPMIDSVPALKAIGVVPRMFGDSLQMARAR
jgi:hypothetical protein